MKEYTFHRRQDEHQTGQQTSKASKYRAATVVVMIDDTWTSWGMSLCSWKDQFNKKLGRQIAYNRAKFCLSEGPEDCRVKNMIDAGSADIIPTDVLSTDKESNTLKVARVTAEHNFESLGLL